MMCAPYVQMRASYAQLYTLNAELIGEYNKRSNNHEQLLTALHDTRVRRVAKSNLSYYFSQIVSNQSV